MRTKILAIVAVTGLVVAFQNCGKVRNTAAPDALSSSSTATANGNVLSNGAESIGFFSINGEPLGNIDKTKITQQNTQFFVPIQNLVTGRKATVVINWDPVAKKFLGVTSTAAPYMCFDSAKGPCDTVVIPAGFTNAGGTAVNCGSPIFFSGALKGSVNNITTEIYKSCGY